MKRPRLKTAKVLPDFKLQLTFINDDTYIVSLADDFERFPGLKPLQEPGAFDRAIVDDSGWLLEWPDLDIQIGADTLWLDALTQNAADENTRIFAQWRVRNGLSFDKGTR